MKSQKGMSHKMLIICIFVLVVLTISIAYLLIKQMKNEKIETYQTNMLLIQGKVKVLSQESVIQKNEEILKGEKLADKLEEDKIKELLNKGVISKEEEKFSNYYIWNNQTVNDVGLGEVTLENGFYIVNYETDEVIYSEGITMNDNVYYKLSEIENEKNKKEVEENQEKTEEQANAE